MQTDSTLTLTRVFMAKLLIRHIFIILLLSLPLPQTTAGNPPSVLTTPHLNIQWQKTDGGWVIARLQHKKNGKWVQSFAPSGEYTLLFSNEKPSDEPQETFQKITGGTFPEPNYHYQKAQWRESITEVALNTGGQAYHFYPEKLERTAKGLTFTAETEVATVVALWQTDPRFPSDVRVTLTLIPKKAGYFSLASPTLGILSENRMQWVSVPGYFQANRIEPNFALAYAYGHGAPDRPVVYRERCASTLSPLLSSKDGATLSVIPEPGLARDPWTSDRITQTKWLLGLSHKNRKALLSPTLYYPVLGEPHALKQAGEPVTWSFRYSLTDGDWFKALKHAANDIYRFEEGLKLRQNRQSLTERVQKMHHYLTDPATSLWHIEAYKGYRIGAQSYLGGVVGSQKDAMKNSDYGAMWMLAGLTGDSLLKTDVLPPARNFKLVQQDTEDPFFKGAVNGQYYLAKSKKFVEEWGEVSEPVALTYYVMLDIGNMLLFDPGNDTLRERLRLGADRLLRWQHPDGSWAVAYDRHTKEPLFQDIRDLRPTFYGLLVAYRLLGDPIYLAAARKGADWLINHAVATGSYLGVCGDARYAPDFATGQTSQTLLDLYELTQEKRYLEAAITAARVYTASIYTHPVPSEKIKMVNGIERKDWEISQAGLSFEHGGIFGSATRHGPIQLASHAGLFIRMSRLTGEPLFRDMARAAAIGRHAFVDDKTSVASYYWNAMNRGAGPYPHHAWWQIGWITDYLMAEAELRSNGKISFPRGFVTPKVGPHQSYGFAPGTVYGEEASLLIREKLVASDNPSIEYVLAQAASGQKLYVVLLNNSHKPEQCRLDIDLSRLHPGKTGVRLKFPGEKAQALSFAPQQQVTLPAYGIRTLCIEYN